MKVTVAKEELQKRLSDIQNIVEKKSTMPILNHILLVSEKKNPHIIATDLETAFKGPIELDIHSEGRICLPARKLLEIVREMEGEISIEEVDAQWAKIRSGKSQFRLATLNPEDFPAWPPLEGSEEMEVEASLLSDMIEKTLYAAGEADARYVLNSLLFHITKDGIFTVVGTDGHRLAVSNKKVTFHPEDEKKLIVSRKAVSELKRFLGDEDRKVKILIGKNHVLFNIDGINFLTRLIDGTYPNYEQVIPTSNKKTLVVDRNLFLKALKRVSIMSRDRSNAVKVDIEAKNMVISAASPDIGEANDEIDADFSAKSMTIAFNARYIIDAINVMSSDQVVMKLNEPLSPVLLMEEGHEDYRCVVMPMRL